MRGEEHVCLIARLRDGWQSPRDGSGKGRCGHPAADRRDCWPPPELGGPLRGVSLASSREAARMGAVRRPSGHLFGLWQLENPGHLVDPQQFETLAIWLAHDS